MISEDGVPEDDDNNAVETPEMFNSYINMEVGLPRGIDGELYHATFKRRAINYYRKMLGFETSNQITDKTLYEEDYFDGTVKILAANVIAENLLSQINQEGHRQLFIDEIINHRKIQYPSIRRMVFTQPEMET